MTPCERCGASLEARRLLATEIIDTLRKHGVSPTWRCGVATGEALVGGRVRCGRRGTWAPRRWRSRRPLSRTRSSDQPPDARTRRGRHRYRKRRSRPFLLRSAQAVGAPAGTAPRRAPGGQGRGTAAARRGLRRRQSGTATTLCDRDRRGRDRQDTAGPRDGAPLPPRGERPDRPVPPLRGGHHVLAAARGDTPGDRRPRFAGRDQGPARMAKRMPRKSPPG